MAGRSGGGAAGLVRGVVFVRGECLYLSGADRDRGGDGVHADLPDEPEVWGAWVDETDGAAKTSAADPVGDEKVIY